MRRHPFEKFGPFCASTFPSRQAVYCRGHGLFEVGLWSAFSSEESNGPTLQTRGPSLRADHPSVLAKAPSLLSCRSSAVADGMSLLIFSSSPLANRLSAEVKGPQALSNRSSLLSNLIPVMVKGRTPLVGDKLEVFGRIQVPDDGNSRGKYRSTAKVDRLTERFERKYRNRDQNCQKNSRRGDNCPAINREFDRGRYSYSYKLRPPP